MALDYHKCAQEISDNIGGGANVVSAAHCATRLRLVIADNGKVNKEALEEIDGVKGMFESNGQLQLIIGTGTVNKVFDEFIQITGVAAGTKDDVKAAAAAKAPIWRQALKTIGDVFVPILPAIVASGLMMGLVEALAKIPGLGFGESDWFAFLDTVANTAFAYLPVIVAVSAARVFGGNLFLGAVTGLLMIHSSFLNGWNVANAEQIHKFFNIPIQDMNPYLFTGDWSQVAAPAIPRWHLIGNIVTIQRSGYQGHVIPVIIAVWLMSMIEKWLHKHVPEMIDLFVTPLCTVLVTAFLTLWIVGPIFSTLETYVLAGAKILVRNPIGSGIMGAIYPWTVVMGLHHMYNVIEAGMLAETGLNTWMPIASAANFAQFGACLAVGLKVRNQKTKSVAVPSSMSAALGITEPAIFGVNMRFFKPFIAGCVGGAVGALLAAFMAFSNIWLMRHEGYRPANALGIIFAALWFLGTVFLLGMELQVFDLGIPSVVRNCLVFAACYLECIFLATVASTFLATRFRVPYDKDYIIILGCRIRKDGTLTPLLKGRVDRALAFEKAQYEKTGKHAVFAQDSQTREHERDLGRKGTFHARQHHGKCLPCQRHFKHGLRAAERLGRERTRGEVTVHGLRDAVVRSGQVQGNERRHGLRPARRTEFQEILAKNVRGRELFFPDGARPLQHEIKPSMVRADPGDHETCVAERRLAEDHVPGFEAARAHCFMAVSRKSTASRLRA